MCSVEVFHGDDGCTSSDLDGGDELGEKKVIGRGKGKKGERDWSKGFNTRATIFITTITSIFK